MARKRQQKVRAKKQPDIRIETEEVQSFHLEFLNQAQKVAWNSFEKHDVLFLIGPPGCGKTMLACAYAISEILSKKKRKITLTRPVVESGESLGFLPGSFEEKVCPYMMPMYDCIDRCVGRNSLQKEIVSKATEVAPVAYLRGRTFNDSICIFDEAQNATFSQIKLFLTRFGINSKIIVTGDPNQSDLQEKDQGLMRVVNKLNGLNGVGIIEFSPNSIVRHPLVSSMLERLEKK